MVDIVQVAHQDAEAYQERIAAVYRAAFGQAPYRESQVDVDRFSRSFIRHIERKGFRCFIACEDEHVFGFAYGYPGEPGGWWRETVAGALSQDMVFKWLDDYFEFAELAVTPRAQGVGIGGQLHDALLSGLPQRTAALSAYQAETRAMRLYRKRGWVPLVSDFRFPGNPMRFVIMGMQLPRNSTVLDQ